MNNHQRVETYQENRVKYSYLTMYLKSTIFPLGRMTGQNIKCLVMASRNSSGAEVDSVILLNSDVEDFGFSVEIKDEVCLLEVFLSFCNFSCKKFMC